MADYKAGVAGSNAPGKFVVRWRGMLVRDNQQMPVLFDTLALAEAEAERLNNG